MLTRTGILTALRPSSSNSNNREELAVSSNSSNNRQALVLWASGMPVVSSSNNNSQELVVSNNSSNSRPEGTSNTSPITSKTRDT